MTKQQQVVLEIYERQNEGVIIFQKKMSSEISENEEAEDTILYSNNAFKKLVGTENDNEGITIAILTKKLEESNLFQSNV